MDCSFSRKLDLICLCVNLSCRVREKGNGTFALSISHHGVTKHYRIDKQRTSTGEKLAIESGPQFDNLMDVSCRNFIISDQTNFLQNFSFFIS